MDFSIVKVVPSGLAKTVSRSERSSTTSTRSPAATAAAEARSSGEPKEEGREGDAAACEFNAGTTLNMADRTAVTHTP
ncbi:hypothetical protein [Streptomyces sp. NPDC055886]